MNGGELALESATFQIFMLTNPRGETINSAVE
jgi:hypothetical protein